MEQLKYLNDIFQLKKLPDLYLGQYGKFTNAEVQLVVQLIFFICNIFGLMHAFTILVFGFALPFWAMYQGQKIRNYFPLLSALLWIRLFYSPLKCLDGILVLCLWHPNIELGSKITEKIVKFVKKDKSIGSKIDKLIDKTL